MRQTTLTGEVAPQGPRGGGIPQGCGHFVNSPHWQQLANCVCRTQKIVRYVRHVTTDLNKGSSWIFLRSFCSKKRAHISSHCTEFEVSFQLSKRISTLKIKAGSRRLIDGMMGHSRCFALRAVRFIFFSLTSSFLQELPSILFSIKRIFCFEIVNFETSKRVFILLLLLLLFSTAPH